MATGFKINYTQEKDDMTLFFTSDEHLGHFNIIKHCNRPFSSALEMDSTIIERFNARVCPEDTVYHLGDFVWHEPHEGMQLKRLNGHHKLVPGNHDRCHPSKGRYLAARKQYERWGFEVLEAKIEMDFPLLGHVLLTHFPEKRCVVTTDPHIDVRYPEWRPN